MQLPVATVASCTCTRSRIWQWQLPVDKFWLSEELKSAMGGIVNRANLIKVLGVRRSGGHSKLRLFIIYLPTQLVEGPLGSFIIQFCFVLGQCLFGLSLNRVDGRQNHLGGPSVLDPQQKHGFSHSFDFRSK